MLYAGYAYRICLPEYLHEPGGYREVLESAGRYPQGDQGKESRLDYEWFRGFGLGEISG